MSHQISNDSTENRDQQPIVNVEKTFSSHCDFFVNSLKRKVNRLKTQSTMESKTFAETSARRYRIVDAEMFFLLKTGFNKHS
jgi:hypothetical protein